MKLPLQVNFRNMKHSPAIEEFVREHSEKLTTFCAGITSCRVTIELPHKHHQSGNLYRVRIDMTVPDAELVVQTKLGEDSGYDDLKVAVRDSFDMATRRLENYTRKRRGMVKTHAQVRNHEEEAEIREAEIEQMKDFVAGVSPGS